MNGSRVKRERRALPGDTGKPGRKHKGLLKAGDVPQGVVRVILGKARRTTTSWPIR